MSEEISIVTSPAEPRTTDRMLAQHMREKKKTERATDFSGLGRISRPAAGTDFETAHEGTSGLAFLSPQAYYVQRR